MKNCINSYLHSNLYNLPCLIYSFIHSYFDHQENGNWDIHALLGDILGYFQIVKVPPFCGKISHDYGYSGYLYSKYLIVMDIRMEYSICSNISRDKKTFEDILYYKSISIECDI